MATPTSTVELLDLVRRSGVLSEDIIARLENGPPLPENPGKLAAALVKQGLLTQFQAKLLLAGKHRGFKLGSYIVRDQIGQGGMGAVYLAEHDTLKRKVALKVLTADKDPLAVKRFAREARSAAALDHPNIVRLHDVAKHGDVHYLVMEYVDGQTLEQLLTSTGQLLHFQLAGWAIQVARGLQHAHERGFVHRDIKPANIMVNKADQAKILDMGLARSGEAGDKLTEMMDKGAVVGTADYISPEQAIYGQCDIRADIYALGATMYTLATGRPPFEGTTSQKLIAHQMTVPPSLADVVPGFPRELADVIRVMMAKNPDDRYQTPSEAVDALVPWASTEGGAKLIGSMAASQSGTNSSVELGVTHSGRINGGSTKRLATPSSKTSPTPVSAVARAAAKSLPPRPASAVSTGRVTRTKPASGKARKREKKRPPAWVMFMASGVSGFIIVAVVVMALFGTKPPKPKFDSIINNPSEPVPVVAAPAKAVSQSTAGTDTKAAIADARDAARQSRWADAAARYLTVVRAEPDNYEHYLMTTVFQAQAGDAPGFRQLRREMVSRFRNDVDPRVRERVAKSSLLLPASESMTTDCARMAETSLAERRPDFPNYAYHVMVVGLSEYRQNKFEAADQRLAQAISSSDPSVTLTTIASFIRAMAQHRLGQQEKARQTFTSAVEQFTALTPNGIDTPRVPLLDYVINLVLRKEVESVLAGSESATGEAKPRTD